MTFDADDEDVRLKEAGGRGSTVDGFAGHPASEVTWYGARAYCGKAGGRLPTEAEWEFAARAGSTTKWYCGDDENCVGGIAWYANNALGETHPGGRKQPNAFGLYDMAGNVREWCEDDWHGDYIGAPEDGSAWIGDPRASGRVLRGGSWGYPASFLRSSNRAGPSPSVANAGVGFRCARDTAGGGEPR